MYKKELYNFINSNNNEAIKLYKEYLNEWLDNNFRYTVGDLGFHIPIKPDFSYDPYYLLDEYIRTLQLNNKTYTNQKDKNQFYMNLSNKVLQDIRDIISMIDINLKNKVLLYFYSFLAYNKNLGLKFVAFQQSVFNNNMGQDDIEKLIYTIVTSASNLNADIESRITKIEQFIATEEDSIELLVKIIQSENINENKSINLTNKSIKKLLALTHTLILIIHTRLDSTTGINKMESIDVDIDGTIQIPEGIYWNEINVSNYNYKFNEEWSEYDDILKDELNKEVFNKFGFDLYDVEKLEKNVMFEKEIMVADKNKYLSMMIKIGISKKRAESLFEFFTFINKNEDILAKNLYKYINPDNYDMLSRKIFINYDGTYFICYKFLVWYAARFFKGLAFENPDKFVQNHEVARKIDDSFCKSIGKKLKKAFPKSRIISNYYCSEDREIDVILILQNKIYLIECKRLSMPITSKEIHNTYNRLVNDFMDQLDEEMKKFEKNKHKIFDDFISKSLINNKSFENYEIKGLIVTKEFSPAHKQETKYPIIIENELIKFIINDIKSIY